MPASALQWALAVLLVKFPLAASAFLVLNRGVDALQRATDAGTSFVFGYLGGGPLPFAETTPGASFIFAFRALPLVLVISALASLLFYWGVLQVIVKGFAWLLRRAMGMGGALALGAAVHVFVGNIEAPLLVRPYLARDGARRVVRADDLRHGRHRRHGHGALCHDPWAGHSGGARKYPDRLGDQHARRPRHRGADGAVRRREARTRLSSSLGAPLLSAIDALAKGTGDGIVFLANIAAMLVVAIAW